MSNNYFTDLNYTLSNEDTFFEYNLLPMNSKHVVSICGSGSRVLPLIAKAPSSLTIIDSSPLQLELCALRIKTVKELNYHDFLAFWGYSKISPNERTKLFMQLNLSPEKLHIWARIFGSHKWTEPIYFGKWEKTIIKLSKMLRILLGSQKIDQLFEFEKFDEYLAFMKNDFPKWRFDLFISFLTRPFLMNILLYKGTHAKFRNPEYNRVSDFYISFFDKLLKQDLAKNNFFLQLALTGRIAHLEGLPAEATETCFNEIKTNIDQVSIQYHQGDFFKTIAQLNNPISFVSLSDVPSYFDKEKEKDHLQLLKNHLTDEAIVCSRYYLNCLANIDSSGFSNITDQYLKAIEKEKTPFYRFDIWKKNTSSGI